MWTSAYFSEYQDEKCGPPPAIVLGQDSRGSNQFFDDVNLAPITLQIPEGKQDMSERQNGIQHSFACLSLPS